MTDQLTRCAHHESGHVVWWYTKKMGRRSIVHVSIVPNRKSGGRVLFRDDDSAGPEPFPCDEGMARLMAELDLSGHAAEAVLLGTPGIWQAPEFDSAWQWLAYAYTPLQAGNAFHGIWNETIDYLADPVRWAGVTALAEALLEERKIIHQRALAIVTDAMERRAEQLRAAAAA